jgi:hypothetical protein
VLLEQCVLALLGLRHTPLQLLVQPLHHGVHHGVVLLLLRRQLEPTHTNTDQSKVIYTTIGRRRPYRMVYGANHRAGQLGET